LGVIAYFLLYNRYPFVPNKIDGAGLPGLTKAVTKRNHTFDPSVQVSEAGKNFINRCLQKSIEKRPYSQDLLNDSWWERSIGWTDITRQYIRNGEQKRPEEEAVNKIKLLFFGASVAHIKKIFDGLLLSEVSIN
jgi:serine/threonine protein kinase